MGLVAVVVQQAQALLVAAEVLEGLAVEEPLVTLELEAHMAVALVELGLTRTLVPLAALLTAASALSVSSGALAVAIRRTLQTSN